MKKIKYDFDGRHLTFSSLSICLTRELLLNNLRLLQVLQDEFDAVEINNWILEKEDENHDEDDDELN